MLHRLGERKKGGEPFESSWPIGNRRVKNNCMTKSPYWPEALQGIFPQRFPLMKNWDNFSSKFPKGVVEVPFAGWNENTYLKECLCYGCVLKMLEKSALQLLWILLIQVVMRYMALIFGVERVHTVVQNCDWIPTLAPASMWFGANFLIFLGFEFLTFKNNIAFQECYKEQWDDLMVPCKELSVQCELISSTVPLNLWRYI